MPSGSHCIFILPDGGRWGLAPDLMRCLTGMDLADWSPMLTRAFGSLFRRMLLCREEYFGLCWVLLSAASFSSIYFGSAAAPRLEAEMGLTKE